MAVTISAKGTSHKSFKIGKQGTTIFQGEYDPTLVESVNIKDVWIDTLTNSFKIFNGTTWQFLSFGGTSIDDGAISSTGNLSLSSVGNLSLSSAGNLALASVGAATVNGSPIITESSIGSGLSVNNGQISAEVSAASVVTLNANRLCTRQASVTHEEIRSGNNQTFTINTSTFNAGDRILLYKSRLQGEITITSSSGTDLFFSPDDTSDTSLIIQNGVSAVFSLSKINSTQWSVMAAG